MAVTAWGKTGGFEVTTRQGDKEDAATLDMSFLTPDYLASFDGLMVMTNGKGLIGTHCASLTMYDYPEFGAVLGGDYLRSLVPTAAVAGGKVGVLEVEDTTHPATRMLDSTWPLNEEFYEFAHVTGGIRWAIGLED